MARSTRRRKRQRSRSRLRRRRSPRTPCARRKTNPTNNQAARPLTKGGNQLDLVLKLRELRRMSGLSQKEAALSSGLGEKTLSSFETGERISAIKLSQLLALLAVYDVTPAEFFGGKVEADVFGELERLSACELQFIRDLRALPER